MDSKRRLGLMIILGNRSFINNPFDPHFLHFHLYSKRQRSCISSLFIYFQPIWFIVLSYFHDSCFPILFVFRYFRIYLFFVKTMPQLHFSSVAPLPSDETTPAPSNSATSSSRSVATSSSRSGRKYSASLSDMEDSQVQAFVRQNRVSRQDGATSSSSRPEIVVPHLLDENLDGFFSSAKPRGARC